MARKSISTRERARLFEMHRGVCHICGGKIMGGEAWDVEHIVPWALTRDDSDENRMPAHRKCHKAKTAKDVGQIAKTKRVGAKHTGAHRSRSPMPCGSQSRLKRKLDGTVVDRETGQPV